jgi:hypothetical protein
VGVQGETVKPWHRLVAVLILWPVVVVAWIVYAVVYAFLDMREFVETGRNSKMEKLWRVG